MPVSIIDSMYFRDMFGTAEMREIFSDENRISCWLDTEVALADAEAEHGVIPINAAKRIRQIAQIESLDLEKMKDDFDRVGFPILPFVKQLTAACDPETAKWVHYGATTQDILDTGTVLQMRQGLDIIDTELRAILKALKNLSWNHRDTVMAGRTFQQLAAPITFGYKAAIWLDELMRHYDRINHLKPRLLVGQCSGAVGTFATLGEKAMIVQQSMMEKLDLGSPDISWHVARDRWTELVSIFTMLSTSLAKIANEIAILMRSEIGELSEPFQSGRGASTTLPQKRNPISCEPIIAISHAMRELSGSQFSAMIQEHERAVGPMHLEWMVIPQVFVMLSGSLHHSKSLLQDLQVYPDTMLANLNLNGGLIMSEAVMMGLAPALGKKGAHDVVSRSAARAHDEGISLKQALMEEVEVTSILDENQVEDLINPLSYVGSAGKMVDNVIKRYETITS